MSFFLLSRVCKMGKSRTFAVRLLGRDLESPWIEV